MRRSIALLCATALGLSGIVAAAPAGAAPATQASSTAAAAVPDELLVGYVDGATAAERERARGRASAQRQEQVVADAADRNAVELVRIPQGANRDQAIADLERDPAVTYAEPNWIYTHQGKPAEPAAKPGSGGESTVPDYFATGDLWGMYGDVGSTSLTTNGFGSQAAESWEAGKTGSKAVYIGVIDEGIQFTHPDLDAQVWDNPYDLADGVDNDGNGYIDDARGWDFANNDSSIYDGGTRGSLDDHGTHVAGTIGAENGSELGVKGVNHSITMISGKFLGRSGGSLANAVKAVDYFTDLKVRHGLNIVATNNSWGGGGFAQGLFDAIVRGAKQNILFIAAAGNGGSDGVGDDNDMTASYPSNYNTTSGADYDAVIAVAAITSSGAKSSFSNYGASTVDLGAPGSGIWSTTAFNGYSSYNGTSMATPHVTGAAALYASTRPTATAAQIKAAILDAAKATPTPSLAGITVTGGRLNVSGF